VSRFTNRRIFRNKNELYEEMLEERDAKYFRQYVTPDFTYPTVEQMKEIKRLKHRWKRGDRFYKLAFEHYGDPNLWWVIAWFNKTPTESHVAIGSIVLVPKPLEKVLKYLGNR
tara:strand:- start:110 stop:448 length:339 start_codon:yes stop_codon:yes gene_type:complete